MSDPNLIEVKMMLVANEYCETIPSLFIVKHNNFDQALLKMKETAKMLFYVRPEIHTIRCEALGIKFILVPDEPQQEERTFREAYPTMS